MASSDTCPPLATTVVGVGRASGSAELKVRVAAASSDGTPGLSPPGSAIKSSSRRRKTSSGQKQAEEDGDASSARRARRSEIERRSRQRRQGSVVGMREQLSALEREYLRLTQRVGSDADGHERGAIVRPSELATLRERFVELSNEAAALREEQTVLQRVLHARQLFGDSFRALRAEFVRGEAPEALEFQWSAVAQAEFEPLAPEECFSIMRDSYEAIARFDSSKNFASTGSTVFGWSDKKRLADTSALDEGCMYFSFSKAFENRDCEQMMRESWRTMSDEAFMRRVIFPPGVHVDLRVLQTINDDAMVVHRHTTYTTMKRSFHTVYLLFRLQTDTGYMVCFRTIPAPNIQNAMEPHEAWINLFHWTALNRQPDATGALTGCEVTFGGSLAAGVLKFAAHWMLELMMTVVRWEQACVAPFCLPQC